jgi:predicted metal-dependent phosphoesterase TrpH
MAEIIRVDLHCHSSASDGDHSPGYVAHQLAASGCVWAALTDHNSVGGQERFQAAVERRAMQYISGLEVHARSPQGPVHLLAYGYDLNNQALLSALQTLRKPLLTSVRQWVVRLFSPGRRATPAVATISSDDHGQSPQRPADTAEAIRLIHEAGGLALLAHPLAGLKTIERLEEFLDWLQPQGLDGIEAFYKLYFRSTQQQLLELAERRGLLTVGGSDFHGLHNNDGTSPGVEMPLEQLDRFVAALGLREEKSVATSRDGGLPVLGGSVEN